MEKKRLKKGKGEGSVGRKEVKNKGREEGSEVK